MFLTIAENIGTSGSELSGTVRREHDGVDVESKRARPQQNAVSLPVPDSQIVVRFLAN